MGRPEVNRGHGGTRRFKVNQQPLRVRHVKIAGNQRTQPHVIERELQEAYSGENFKEVTEGLLRGLNKLESLDIFESVKMECVDVDPAETGGEQCTDVLIHLREKGPLKLKAETFVEGGGSEGGVESSIGLRNVLGGAEKVEGAIAYGTTKSNLYRLMFTKPRILGYPFDLLAELDDRVRVNAAYSSYDEKRQEATVSLRDHSGAHSLGCTVSWRDLLPVRNASNPYQYDASSTIINHARPSLKNSVQYTLNLDGRDNPVTPTQGGLFRCESELAGFGGDVSFAKAKVTTQLFQPLLGLPFVLGLTLRGGLLYPLSTLGNAYNESHVSDRFWMGGPLDFRGFTYKGVGPRSAEKTIGAKGGDSLGGDIMWSIGTALSFPREPLDIGNVRGQFFLNAGNLTEWGASFRTIVRGARASCGLGVILPLPIGRLEATYSYVLRSNGSDQTRGFQLGFGVDFT